MIPTVSTLLSFWAMVPFWQHESCLSSSKCDERKHSLPFGPPPRSTRLKFWILLVPQPPRVHNVRVSIRKDSDSCSQRLHWRFLDQSHYFKTKKLERINTVCSPCSNYSKYWTCWVLSLLISTGSMKSHHLLLLVVGSSQQPAKILATSNLLGSCCL